MSKTLKKPTPSLDNARARKAVAQGALTRKLQAVREGEQSWLNNDDLRGLGIKAEFHAVFNKNATRFFTPLQVNPLDLVQGDAADEFGSLWADDKDYSLAYSTGMRMGSYLDMKLNPAYSEDELLRFYGPWIGVPHIAPSPEILYEMGDNYPYPWTTYETYVSEHHPHVIVHSVQGLPPDRSKQECLSRGEIIVALNAVSGRLREKVFVEHQYFPVLLISYFAESFRVVEAYYDGETVNFSLSPFIQHSEYNKDDLKFVLRWVLSEPTGDTRAELKAVPSACDNKENRLPPENTNKNIELPVRGC